MKNLKKLFIRRQKALFPVLSLLFFIGLTSCENENIESNINDVQQPAIENNDQSDITVEFATLEELNDVFIENGLEPISQESYEKRRRNAITKYGSRQLYCGLIPSFGDYTQDSTFSSLDIIEANKYVLNYYGWSMDQGGFVDPTTGHIQKVV
jgi:hypothetical protein